MGKSLVQLLQDRSKKALAKSKASSSSSSHKPQKNRGTKDGIEKNPRNTGGDLGNDGSGKSPAKTGGDPGKGSSDKSPGTVGGGSGKSGKYMLGKPLPKPKLKAPGSKVMKSNLKRSALKRPAASEADQEGGQVDADEDDEGIDDDSDDSLQVLQLQPGWLLRIIFILSSSQFSSRAAFWALQFLLILIPCSILFKLRAPYPLPSSLSQLEFLGIPEWSTLWEKTPLQSFVYDDNYATKQCLWLPPHHVYLAYQV